MNIRDFRFLSLAPIFLRRQWYGA